MRDVLAEEGQIDFWQVAMKPGELLVYRRAAWQTDGHTSWNPGLFHGPLRVVRASGAAGRCKTRSIAAQGSGILTAMLRANSFVVIPEESGDAAAGQTATVMLLEWRRAQQAAAAVGGGV